MRVTYRRTDILPQHTARYAYGMHSAEYAVARCQ